MATITVEQVIANGNSKAVNIDPSTCKALGIDYGYEIHFLLFDNELKARVTRNGNSKSITLNAKFCNEHGIEVGQHLELLITGVYRIEETRVMIHE